MQIVSRCHRSAAAGQTRFLLNCRTYLFTTASERLEAKTFKMSDFECRLSDRDLRPHAEAILKQHLEHSTLSPERKDQLWAARHEIVQSRCFTPGLIGQLIMLDPEDDFRKQLSDPSFIWHKTVQSMVKDPHQAALIAVATANIPENGSGCAISVLLTAWLSFLTVVPSSASAASSVPSVHTFHSVLRSLEGSLLKRFNIGGTESMLFYNGSVTDYLMERIHTDSAVLERLLVTAATAQQIVFLGRRSISDAEFPALSAPFSLSRVLRHLLDNKPNILLQWQTIWLFIERARKKCHPERLRSRHHSSQNGRVLPRSACH